MRFFSRMLPMQSPSAQSMTSDRNIRHITKGLPQLKNSSEVIISIRFLYSELLSSMESIAEAGKIANRKIRSV